jgi:predicted ATP-grasp superfamily ATP-dependent carboligase
LPALSVSLVLDARCVSIAADFGLQAVLIQAGEDIQAVFTTLLATVDAVWLIAPETAGILQRLSEQVLAAGKRLLGCSPAAVALTADKWQTYQCLQHAGLPTPATQLLRAQTPFLPGCWVIKPRDGVGCSTTWLVDTTTGYNAVLQQLAQPEDYLLQAFVPGKVQSVSCLFAGGRAWVLCVNTQQVSIHDQQFSLQACQVNSQPVTAAQQAWVQTLAQAIPGLFGYVGIDFIAGDTSNDADWLLEINPRLTSSYAGIYAALGVNVVEWVLALPELAQRQPTRNQSVCVALTEGA